MKALLLGAALLIACGASTSFTTGIVVAVEGDLTTVTEFTIRLADGEKLTLRPNAESTYEFPLPHLRQHMATGETVRVVYSESADGLVLLEIEDG